MENGKYTQFLIDLAYRLSLSMDFLRCSLRRLSVSCRLGIPARQCHGCIKFKNNSKTPRKIIICTPKSQTLLEVHFL